MCCATLVAQEAAMATTQLMRAASYEIGWTRQKEVRTGHRPPRMNWVVVTAEDQNRPPQMRWEPSADNR